MIWVGRCCHCVSLGRDSGHEGVISHPPRGNNKDHPQRKDHQLGRRLPTMDGPPTGKKEDNPQGRTDNGGRETNHQRRRNRIGFLSHSLFFNIGMDPERTGKRGAPQERENCERGARDGTEEGHPEEGRTTHKGLELFSLSSFSLPSLVSGRRSPVSVLSCANPLPFSR